MSNTKKSSKSINIKSNKKGRAYVAKYGKCERSITGIGDLKIQHEKSTSNHSEILATDPIGYFFIYKKSDIDKSFSLFYVLGSKDSFYDKFEKIHDWNYCIYGKAIIELETEGGRNHVKYCLEDVSIQYIPCGYNNIFADNESDRVQLHFVIETEDDKYAFVVFKDIKQAIDFVPFIGEKVNLSIKIKYEK